MARDTDFIGFSFNGRHSSDFNIYSVSNGSRYQDDLVPNPIDYTEEIPGGVGQYYFGSDTDIKEFSLNIAYDNLTEKGLREMRKWLSPNSIGEIVFDERPYKTYIGKIRSAPSLTYICFQEDTSNKKVERIYKGEGTIDFICYYPYAKTSKEKKELKYFENQIDESNSKEEGGNSFVVSYEVDGEAAKLENLIGKTVEDGTGDKGPDNPYQLIGSTPSQVKICGKNFLSPFGEGLISGVSYSTKEDGSLTLNGTASLQIYLNSEHFFLTPGTYTFSSNIALPNQVTICLRTVSSTNVVSRLSGSVTKDTFEISKSSEYFVFISIRPGVIVQNLNIRLQIESGLLKTEYEKYNAKVFALDNIPTLYSSPLSNDTFNIITKNYTQKCFKFSLNGTESWKADTYASTGETYFSCALPYQAGDGAAEMDPSNGFTKFFCSHFSPNLTLNSNRVYIYNSGNRICFFHSGISDVSEWASWLSEQNSKGTPVEIVYARNEPEMTIRESDNNIIYNIDKNFYKYYTNSDTLISLRIYNLLYSTINEWAESSGLLYDLNLEGEGAGYDHFIPNVDGSGNINLYNPGDLETDFILSFNKPDTFSETTFLIDGERYFTLSLRKDKSESSDLYGAASPEEVTIANMTGGVITIDSKKRRITYKNSSTGFTSPIYYALKKGDFFKIPINRIGDENQEGYTLNISRELEGVEIQYDYLYY